MEHSHTSPQPAEFVAGLLAALTHIDNVGFHGIATNLTGASPKIDRNWAALIHNAHIAVAVTAWPGELEPAAERFTAAAHELVAVLERRDVNAVADPAKELHIAYHALSDAGWNHLAKSAGMTHTDAHQHGAGEGGHQEGVH